MFGIAIITGIYSYLILILGLLNLLNFVPTMIVTLLVLALSVIWRKNDYLRLINIRLNSFIPIEKALAAVLVIMVVINLIGALGPELAFDALWYHLTIPKLYAEEGRVYFIEGGLFYYSLMPRLTEMLYASSLILGNEIVAKLIHFSFGLLSSFAVFKLSRLYLSRVLSLTAVAIFYSNLVVSWLSITAYTDLSRAFYECMALYYFLKFTKKRRATDLASSALMLGFGICTKLLSIGTLGVYVLIIVFIEKLKMMNKLKYSLFISFLSLGVVLPWLLLSYFYTGNPVYPLFTHLGLRNFSIDLLSPFVIFKTLVNTFLFAPDPLNPFYLIVLPLILVNLKRLFKKYKILLVYSILSFIVWYMTSQSGGTRFLTSYLPAYTLLGLLALNLSKNLQLLKTMIILTMLIALITIFYRGIANAKYVPYIMGQESKQDFLMKNLNFSFGDFYDENNEIKKIVGEEKVLLYGLHNIFYVDFKYTLPEWNTFPPPSYLLVQDGNKSVEHPRALKVYENAKTHVVLYKL